MLLFAEKNAFGVLITEWQNNLVLPEFDVDSENWLDIGFLDIYVGF